MHENWNHVENRVALGENRKVRRFVRDQERFHQHDEAVELGGVVIDV
jgi:hypothetical protein